MNNKLYKEELLWQSFCRDLELALDDDIDDVDFIKTLNYRIAMEDLIN